MANIVVCADGTWNRPEEDLEKDFPSNVLMLARAIAPADQHVFYDWGLGSYHDRVVAGVSGRGIHKNIIDGYRYIVQNYAEGDRIFLFGFSRGAYTVRALCGLINNCGIVKRPHAALIEQAWSIYKSSADRYHPDADAAESFRAQHSHPSRAVHFVGVWDTVGALGVPFSFLGLLDSRDEFYDTKMGPNVAYARHALSIDERREDFAPTIWTPRPGVDLKQVWFAGVHSDVGGAYPPDDGSGARASDIPLAWMIKQAAACGLRLEEHLAQGLSNEPAAQIHRSRRHIFRFKKPLVRSLIVEGKPTRVHPSVRLRYEADAGYRPPQLESVIQTEGWAGFDVGE